MKDGVKTDQDLLLHSPNHLSAEQLEATEGKIETSTSELSTEQSPSPVAALTPGEEKDENPTCNTSKQPVEKPETPADPQSSSVGAQSTEVVEEMPTPSVVAETALGATNMSEAVVTGVPAASLPQIGAKTESTTQQPSGGEKTETRKPGASRLSNKNTSGGNLRNPTSSDQSGQETESETVIRMFDAGTAAEIAATVEWVGQVTGGLNVSVTMIVEVALSEGKPLTEAYLTGYRSVRTPEQERRRGQATEFLTFLRSQFSKSSNRKLLVAKTSLDRLSEFKAQIDFAMESNNKEVWVFREVWREGGALAIKTWLRKRARQINKALNEMDSGNSEDPAK